MYNEQILIKGHKPIIYQIFPRLPASVDLPARLWLFRYLGSKQLQLVVCNGKYIGIKLIFARINFLHMFVIVLEFVSRLTAAVVNTFSGIVSFYRGNSSIYKYSI